MKNTKKWRGIKDGKSQERVFVWLTLAKSLRLGKCMDLKLF